MTYKIHPVLSIEDYNCNTKRQNYLKKVKNNYSSSTRLNRVIINTNNKEKYNEQSRRITDYENMGGKKTRKTHIGSKFISRIRLQEKKRLRRVAACNEWLELSEN